MEEMNEVAINATKQCKRRLPMRMQRNEKCGNSTEIYSTSENEKETRNDICRIVSISSQSDVILVEKEKGPNTIKNYSKKNTRKPKRGGSFKDSTGNFIRSKRKVEGDIIGMTNDEAELSVEDLLSIAEEHLSADKVMQHEQSVTRKLDSFKSNFFPVACSPALEAKLNTRSCQSLSKCNQTGHSTCFSSSRITQFEDAAQDMLELFLGPLLKTAPLKEFDQEITRELQITNYESDGLVRNSVDEECAPLMKKQS